VGPLDIPLSWPNDSGYEKIRRAHALAEYVSHGEPADADEFTQALRTVWAEEWEFAKRHMAFHGIQERLNTLDQILRGFGREVVELQSNIGAMASIRMIYGWESQKFREGEDRCVLVIRNLASLHGTFIDVARTLMGEIPIEEAVRARAIERLTKGSEREHAFLKDLRNCMLHYAIPAPGLVIRYSDVESHHLIWEPSALLFIGYKWKRAAKEYLFSGKDNEIELPSLFFKLHENLAKQYEFFHRAAKRRQQRNYLLYQSYNDAWRSASLQKSKQLTRAFRLQSAWKRKQG
jgi:hypothetical protein